MAQEDQSANQQFNDPESVRLTTSTCFPYDLLNCQLKQCHRCRLRMCTSFLFIKEETFKIETVNNIDQQLLISEWVNYLKQTITDKHRLEMLDNNGQ
ncbi:Larval serum protein 1 gamma chain [Trichinella pseudospiralis]